MLDALIFNVANKVYWLFIPNSHYGSKVGVNLHDFSRYNKV